MTSRTESSLKKTWNILMPFAVYFIAHDLAQVLLAFLVNVSLGPGGNYAEYMIAHAQTVNGFLNALSLLIGMAFVWPMARKEFLLGKTDREQMHEKRFDEMRNIKQTFTAYILLAIFAVTLALGTNILLILTGVVESSRGYQDVVTRQFGVAFTAGIVIYGVLSPLAEEVVFRGLIYNRMKRYFNPTISIVVCGILFGGYHGNLVQGIYGCILGIAITFAYEVYRSFAAPVLFHSLANLSVFIAGYNRQGLIDMATLENCAFFMTISLVSLFFILKVKKNNL
ncbi:MAG: CPBP family intramembrane metalloprotease [Clostridiales bacterium]|nr:CPBP family intramembrane metalloprotease [Clostridiales bacterium]